MRKIKSVGDFAWVAIGLALLACGASCKPSTPFRPACTALDAAEIDARHLAELVKECRAEGAKSVDTCKAAPAIREKYRAERARWVECAQ